MILVAVAYAVIGVGFGLLASSADTHYVRLWRLAAWGAGAVVAAGQVEYEHFRLGSSPRSTALHAAGAVALGAFGLALEANIHCLCARRLLTALSAGCSWRSGPRKSRRRRCCWRGARRSSSRSPTPTASPPSRGVRPP